MNIKIYPVLIGFMLLAVQAWAGNPDRQGQAGASELLLNPWGISSGLNSMNTSSTQGVEAMRMNIAGLSRIKKIEIGIANNNVFAGTGVNFNGLGLGIKMNKTSVLGIEFTSLDFGSIPITTINQPAGTGGSFTPSFFQLGLGYSYTYANKISVGALVRIVSEAIQDVSSTGIALDAGVQYVSGDKDNFKLGIALRNIGAPMKFGGEGLAVQRDNLDPSTGGVVYQITYDARAASFELPSLLNLGLSYDFYFDSDLYLRALTNFTSNAFQKDQLGVGAEFNIKDIFIVRGSYKFDIGSSGEIETPNVFTGLSAGATLNAKLDKNGDRKVSFDYAYRTTNPFNGSHNFSIRFNF